MSHELLLHSKMKIDTPTTFCHSEDSCEKVVIVCLSLGCEQINGGCYNLGQIKASPKSVSDHEHLLLTLRSKAKAPVKPLSSNSLPSRAEWDFHCSV